MALINWAGILRGFICVAVTLLPLSGFCDDSKASAAAKPVPFDFPLDEKPFIAANYIVEITEYDAVARVYHLKRPQFPNANGLYATPESLVAAVQTLELSVLKKKPTSIVGNEYETDHDLIVLTSQEIEKRRAQGKTAR